MCAVISNNNVQKITRIQIVSNVSVCVWGRQVAICIRLRRLCVCVCVYAQRRLSALSGDVCPAVDVSLCGPVTITTSALLPSHLPTSPWHLFVLVVVIIIVVDLVVVALGFSSYHTL